MTCVKTNVDPCFGCQLRVLDPNADSICAIEHFKIILDKPFTEELIRIMFVSLRNQRLCTYLCKAVELYYPMHKESLDKLMILR